MAKNQLCAIAFDCFSMSDTTKLPTFACVNDVALNREDWRERSGLGVAEKEKVLEIYGVSYHILRAFASRFFRTASRDEYISAEGKVEVEAFEQFLKELATFIGTAAALTPELRLLPIDREHGGCQIGIDVSTAEAIRSKILAMRERNVACAMAFDCHLMLGEGYKIPPAKFARLNEFLWSTREWIHKGTLAGIVRWDVVCTHGVSYDRLKESVLDEFGPAGIAQFISEKGEVNVGALVPILAAHAASLCSRDGGVRRLGAADRSHINPPALQSSFKQ
ncbi:hypothetical protein D9O50_03485 [Oxalobacteraceae bacterium CAVE-383]|nr:hypothetical protein D9O50_03485 [Oxalobacteraceae bacterium CAVE-383]